MLSLKAVSKSFENHKVLDKVTFRVEAGQCLGLAGPSGSGKSTLLRCIQKLETIDSGHIDSASGTGFMFQDFQLFPHMTVLDNLTYAPRRRHHAGEYESQAFKLLEQLGLKDKAKAFPGRLSGGQKQRVALARTLMMSPKILLCDEPTSGLDVASINEVVDLLHSVRAMGITMIIASHDLDFLTQVANTIVLLKNGQIKTSVDPSTLEDPIKYLKEFYSS